MYTKGQRLALSPTQIAHLAKDGVKFVGPAECVVIGTLEKTFRSTLYAVELLNTLDENRRLYDISHNIPWAITDRHLSIPADMVDFFAWIDVDMRAFQAMGLRVY